MQSPSLDNLTPFAFGKTAAFDLDDHRLMVMCVAGRFRLPAAGRLHEGVLKLADEQPPPPMADQHWGNPAQSSLRYAGQGTPPRSGTEVYLQGSARAPGARPVSRMRTRIRVGSCSKEILVVGDRFWRRGVGDPGATSPRPFLTLPLTYERAFGGTARGTDGEILAQDARNPVGRGIHATAADAIDQPLPNLEAPGDSLTSWNGRAAPCAYGPLPGSWQPRLGFAGTYDQTWLDQRLPLWPHDTDPRFFNAAAPGLIVAQALKGGEPCVLEGFSADGAIAFYLPALRIGIKNHFADRVSRAVMQLEGVLIETDEDAITLYWRHSQPIGRGPGLHLRAVVRILESWEAEPR